MNQFKDGSEYGIDLTSSEIQKMSEQLTTHSVLQETVYGWLKGTTMFFSATDMAKLTYADFAEHIGNDANEFFYDTKYNGRTYTWCASDKNYAKLTAIFRENSDGEWVIYASGSSQITMPDSYLNYLKNR